MKRQMQPALAAWLDSLSPSDRRIHLALAQEDFSPALSGLLQAVAAEIRADEWREAIALRRLEDDHRAYVEELAANAVWPNGTPERTTGPAATYDPDTGSWRVEDE